MQSARIQSASQLTVAIVFASLIGATMVLAPNAGFVAWAGLLGLVGLFLPVGVWAAFAITAALTFRGLVTLGLLPPVATFIDIPLVWTALGLALIRNRSWARDTRIHRGLGLLALSLFAAWIAHPSEALRPILYLALIGEPFALLAALQLDPPAPRLRRRLTGLVIALGIVQFPLVLYQRVRFGLGVPNDLVQSDPTAGTLFGAGAGAHVIGGVATVAAIWVLSRNTIKIPLRLSLAALLFSIPFMSDARQVLLALPATLLIGLRRGQWGLTILRGGLALTAVALLLSASSSAQVTLDQLERARAGRGGKATAARIVWSEISQEPTSLLFGLGPAETVSKAAFMTTDRFVSEDSPLRTLDLHPARLAEEAQARAELISGAGSSFHSATSSALGVLGDLGLVGLIAYALLLGTTIRALTRHGSSSASAAAACWLLFATLGLVFDWWEQPAFSLYLALISALSLAEAPQSHKLILFGARDTTLETREESPN